ncbi:MAG: TauD/TfdA family dioxygenase [Ilumatobacter sp.]|uniref:TauD/TfdA family dioxygenase n=1 Tax=Ilumatobacter sp. TaxID=1967498 RepID=UPI002626479A|nr:TauD/TfdA family dioxygenase [Ilumatobacter sp.]MDJ0767919.1 TauD/TfdA family dioxygenase [Ilumatobacter sp.]
MTDTIAQSSDLIRPSWWTGSPAVPADSYVVDAAEFLGSDGRVAVTDALAERMRSTFRDVGLVHVVNTGLTEHSDMRAIAKLVVDAEMAYRAGANPRGVLEPNVYEIGAPLEAWLHYHHEMAYVGTSTKMVAFLCKRELPGRGATFVSDNLQATDALMATEFGRKLARLGVCYRRDLTDREAFVGREPIGVYNHWQHSLATDDPAEAEARAQERGLQTSWGPDRVLQTRYYVSAFEHFPQLDRNVLYSSVADHAMWFDAWPLVEQLPPEQRPLWMTFGDDSDFTREELELFVDVYDRFGTPIDWRVGDVAVICNYRFAHGRPSIRLAAGEERELGVLLGEPFQRVGDVADRW